MMDPMIRRIRLMSHTRKVTKTSVTLAFYCSSTLHSASNSPWGSDEVVKLGLGLGLGLGLVRVREVMSPSAVFQNVWNFEISAAHTHIHTYKYIHIACGQR